MNIFRQSIAKGYRTRKPCYRRENRAMLL